MSNIDAQIEQIARDCARTIVGLDGWMADINNTVRRMRKEFTDAAMVNPTSGPLFGRVADRCDTILRGYYNALASNDTYTVIGQFFDLMPPDIQAKINKGAAQVLTECGVEVDHFKDESGQTFVRVNGVEKICAPDDEITRLAADLPSPVGQLQRLH